MKKLFLSLAMILSLSAVLAHGSFAAVESNEDSTITVSFEENKNPSEPVDPDDPSKPGDGGGTGAPGPLSIDFVSSLAFGTGHKVSSSEQVYKTTTAKPYLQVTDLRGTGGGWKVTAKVSAFSDGTTQTLKGAVVSLKNGTALSSNPSLTAPTVSQNIVLTTDSTEVNVLSAPSGSGLGTWITKWYTTSGENDRVTLTVPASVATVGSHTATITWMLNDTP